MILFFLYLRFLITTILVYIFSICSLQGQNEANIWYFGQNAGINFNNGSPIALTNGALNTVEGSASISDDQGNLLFYTDGVTVWNKNHSVMINGTGLYGHESTTQSAIIVKKPGSNNLYYIFTQDYQGNSNGFSYSIVNMNNSGGLGMVTLKNSPILPSTCEKITAIRHENKSDYWITVHLYGSNAYHSYLLSSSGLSLSPAVSNIGTIISGPSNHTTGALKSSIDGTRIAAASNILGIVDLFDFDISTGLLSNSMSFNNFLNDRVYGVEFSPNGQFLYISGATIPTSNIYQFNLSGITQSAIANSRLVVGTMPTYAGAIQLGPDGKIYCAKSFFDLSGFLGVINSPNQAGLGSDYILDGFHLGGKFSNYGLPSFSNFTNDFNYTNTCFNDSTEFIGFSLNMDSVLWDFDDPNSGGMNNSQLIKTKHLFSGSGSYNVKLYVYAGNVIDTITKEVIIKPLPVVYLGNDTSLCSGEQLTLSATLNNASYLWQDSSTLENNWVSQQGLYWVEVTADGCFKRDSINIAYNNFPQFNIGNDTNLCQGDTIILDAYTINSTYLWSDGLATNIYHATIPGTYFVSVTQNNCTSSDTINISNLGIPTINLGNDLNLCAGDEIILSPRFPGAHYLWNDNSSNSTHQVTSGGEYWVKLTNDCGTAYDTINVISIDCSTELLLPNVITPNGDGINDFFIPVKNTGVISMNTKVYNRWGQLIFNTEYLNIYWDGRTPTGKKVPNGTYFWIINFIDKNGEERISSGYLSLIN